MVEIIAILCAGKFVLTAINSRIISIIAEYKWTLEYTLTFPIFITRGAYAIIVKKLAMLIMQK